MIKPVPIGEADLVILREMYNEFINNRLIVKLMAAPEERHSNHKMRGVEEINCDWYRDFFHSYRWIKRVRVQIAFIRLFRTKQYKFEYDFRLRQVVDDYKEAF